MVMVGLGGGSLVDGGRVIMVVLNESGFLN